MQVRILPAQGPWQVPFDPEGGVLPVQLTPHRPIRRGHVISQTETLACVRPDHHATTLAQIIALLAKVTAHRSTDTGAHQTTHVDRRACIHIVALLYTVRIVASASIRISSHFILRYCRRNDKNISNILRTGVVIL